MSGQRQTIAIFGPGLMGGSLLMALRQRSPQTCLRVWGRRGEVLAELQKRGLADFCSTAAGEAARGADFAVLCVPVDKLAETARAAVGSIAPTCVVTDVGSVKGAVVEELENVFAAHGNFVGSHPMCGSEASGLEAARADLYENALCVLTPTSCSNAQAVARTEDLWKSVGCRVLRMAPAEHDRAAALVSHVPHVAAAALVQLLAGESAETAAMCAGGFRDTTRVASGSPDLWAAILCQNRNETLRGLEKLGDVLSSFKAAVKANNMPEVAAMLAQARDTRRVVIPTS
jgi:prephenate dehydrogenase